MNEQERIDQINQILKAFFADKGNPRRVKALEMMDKFVDAGIFNKDYERKGLPIRNLLRSLDSQNTLYKIPYVWAERTPNCTYWYFEDLTLWKRISLWIQQLFRK